MVEQWRSIPFEPFNESHEVSNFGVVRNKIYPSHTITPQTHKLGYIYVSLQRNKKRKNFSVHRLVLAAFKGVCPLGMESDHIDRNKSNNCLENLRYVTKSENNTGIGHRQKRVKDYIKRNQT